MRETLLELSHGLGEPEQDLRIVSHQAQKDTLNDIVLTSGYAEDLGMCSWRCEGSEEDGEEGGRSKAEMCCAWTVGHATSISEVYLISLSHMYMRETLPELSHSLGEPEQDLCVVSHWALNDTLRYHTYSTSGYAEGLGNAPMEVWGRQGGGKLQGAAKPVATARGLWTALQGSVRHMRYLCNTCTWGETLPELLPSLGEPGQDLPSCKPLDTE